MTFCGSVMSSGSRGLRTLTTVLAGSSPAGAPPRRCGGGCGGARSTAPRRRARPGARVARRSLGALGALDLDQHRRGVEDQRGRGERRGDRRRRVRPRRSASVGASASDASAAPSLGDARRRRSRRRPWPPRSAPPSSGRPRRTGRTRRPSTSAASTGASPVSAGRSWPPRPRPPRRAPNRPPRRFWVLLPESGSFVWFSLPSTISGALLRRCRMAAPSVPVLVSSDPAPCAEPPILHCCDRQVACVATSRGASRPLTRMRCILKAFIGVVPGAARTTPSIIARSHRAAWKRHATIRTCRTPPLGPDPSPSPSSSSSRAPSASSRRGSCRSRRCSCWRTPSTSRPATSACSSAAA